MSDRPIIFSAPMVRALLEGRKTQTRRILKPQPNGDVIHYGLADDKGAYWTDSCWESRRLPIWAGDRLWVRENFSVHPDTVARTDIFYPADSAYIEYPTDDARHEWCERMWNDDGSKHPSIHMPRWASRLTLTVTDVRVQRLQEIDDADARAEGAGLYVPGHGFITEDDLKCDPGYSNFLAPRRGFEAIWAEINGPDAWGANPWIAAYTFMVERRNIDSAA